MITRIRTKTGREYLTEEAFQQTQSSLSNYEIVEGIIEETRMDGQTGLGKFLFWISSEIITVYQVTHTTGEKTVFKRKDLEVITQK
jgi:hypothetical protein